MSKYPDWLEPEGLIKIEGWARDGALEEQIAANIGISQKTLIEWKKKYPPLKTALKKGKEVVDIQVENALLKSALGYETTEYVIDGGKKKAVKKQVAPSVTAQIFWLKNRKPEVWRDKRDVGVEGNLPVVLSGDEEVKD